MARVVIVPGLAVRGYAIPAARALVAAGHEAHLLRAPAWRGAPADLGRYGRMLAADLARRGSDVDLLVGLSVGGQAAAVAAAASPHVRRLLLVSPTVDPVNRTPRRLLARWLGLDEGAESPGFVGSLPDWSRAGIPRIAVGFASALRLPLERVLPWVAGEVVIVRAARDTLGTPAWAERLATVSRGRLIELDDVHSWPVGDPAGFVRVVDEVLA